MQQATIAAMQGSGGTWQPSARWNAGPQANACKTIRILQALEARGFVQDIGRYQYTLTDAGWHVWPSIEAYAEGMAWLRGENLPTPKARKQPMHIVRKGANR